MKILVDENIPCVAEAFADLGEVRLMPGRDIRRQHLQDCRCLVVRTVTRVDCSLLDDTPVEFVGSATIGTDHIDLDYLQSAGIGYSNAAGCNAEAAAEYVISGLFALASRRGLDPLRRRAGIIGCGNVGSRLIDKLEILGIEHLVCDPPLQQRGRPERPFVDLDEILQECDFISLHLPLTRRGEHPSYHMLDRERLARLTRGCLLVNAARGGVVDNRALLETLAQRQDLLVFLDTWENEPLVNRELLQRVDIATPHIAGYSVEGRLRGTQMVLDAACRHFACESSWQMTRLLPQAKKINPGTSGRGLESWQALFHQHCDIWRDHDALVAAARADDASFAAHFDGLRRVYPDRLEYEHCRVDRQATELPPTVLERLGFQLTG